MEEMLKEDNDNYNGKHVFATANGVLKGMQLACVNYSKLETPYIMFQGGVDKYIDPFAAIDLERESQSKDKTTIIYKDMWHEIHHEAEYEEICEMSASWLKERLWLAEWGRGFDLKMKWFWQSYFNVLCFVLCKIFWCELMKSEKKLIKSVKLIQTLSKVFDWTKVEVLFGAYFELSLSFLVFLLSF